AAVIVPPPHEPVRPLGVWTKRLAGKVSVKPTPVRGAEPGLVMANVNVELCPMEMVGGLNALVMLGGTATTITLRVAVPGFPVVDVIRLPPLIPLPVVLTFTPVVTPVTSTLNVHVSPGW